MSDVFDSTALVPGEARDARLTAIVVVEGSAHWYTLPTPSEIGIGRFTGNQLVIDHDTLSRLHAILRLGPTMTVEDLGSANGTFVREVRCEPGQQVPVVIGDVIRLGNVLVILMNAIPSES